MSKCMGVVGPPLSEWHQFADPWVRSCYENNPRNSRESFSRTEPICPWLRARTKVTASTITPFTGHQEEGKTACSVHVVHEPGTHELLKLPPGSVTHLSRLMDKANHITMPDFPGGMCAQRVGIFKDYPDPLSPEIPALCSIHPVYEVHQVFEQSPAELHPRLGRGRLAMDSSPTPSVRRTSTHTWSPLSALCP